MFKNTPLVIWDCIDEVDVPHDSVIILWSRIVTGDEKTISIPFEVERDIAKLREEFLQWTYDIANLEIGAKTLKEHLILDSNYISMWWMTLLADKSPLLLPEIYDILKLRQFEYVLGEEVPQSVTLYSDNDILHQILNAWANSKAIPYTREIPKKNSQRTQSIASHIARGYASLAKRVWRRFRHFSLYNHTASKGTQSTIVSYFPNINMHSAAEGRFESRYWTKLHDVLDQRKEVVNWFFHYVDSPELSFSQSVALARDFNQKSKGKNKFSFLEEFLSLKSIWEICSLHLRSLLRGRFVEQHVKERCSFQNSMICFWPLLQQAWYTSVYGTRAMSGLMLSVIFRQMFSSISEQKYCLYLWENQSWEKSLLFQCQQLQPECVTIGFQHGAVGEMDLRYFDKKELYDEQLLSASPLPDVLAVNGAAVWQLMARNQYPISNMRIVESLRYLSLNEHIRTTSEKKKGNRILLVLAGYDEPETNFQFKLLLQSCKIGGLKNFDLIFVKPHPMPSFSMEKYWDMMQELPVPWQKVSTPLSELLPQVDVVYCANSTSSVLEGLYAGKPTVVSICENGLNLSPIMGVFNYDFVVTPEELSAQLAGNALIVEKLDYYCLDYSLDRWKALLDSLPKRT